MSRLLLDTHLLIWGVHQPERLSEEARARILAAGAEAAFSAASVWEVAIKTARGRGDFVVDAAALRAALRRNGLHEVAITGAHAAEAAALPPLHKDPFDRMLVAQARLEGARLLTMDAAVARYGTPVTLVA